MNPHDEVQFVGGPLDGQESSVWELKPEFHFPKLHKGFHWMGDDKACLPVAEDIYVRLLDTSIYIFKGTQEQ